MRIMLFEQHLHDNGAIRVSLDRAARWQQAGDDVRVLLARPSSPDANQITPPAGLPIEQALRSGRLRYTLPGGLLRLAAEARRSDVVVSGREVSEGLLLGSLVARIARRPFAVTVHSRFDLANEHYTRPAMRKWTWAALRSADLAVAVSQGVADNLRMLRFPQRRIRVVTNGIDAGALRARAGEPAPTPVPARPYVVALGRLSLEKGFDTLVRAHAQVLQSSCTPHQLLIIGEGPERDALMDLIAELGVGDTVTMTGFLDNPFPLLARADLFVLSSRWEGYALALAEALLLGVPAVATDCVAGPRELLRDGELGRLVPVDDVSALSAAMEDELFPTGGSDLASERVASIEPQVLDPLTAADQHRQLLQQLVGQRRRPLRDMGANIR